MMDYVYVLPEIMVLVACCVNLLITAWLPTRHEPWVYGITQLIFVLACMMSVWLWYQPDAVLWHGALKKDALGTVLSVVLLPTMLLVNFYGRKHIKEAACPSGEYYVLGGFALLGMMLLVRASHLLVVFLGLELVSLPLYALVALQRGTFLSPEAAAKYFILGALGSGLFLYGISMLYGASGSLELDVLAHVLTADRALAELMIARLGLAFLLVGLAFKFGVVPFHMWLPDVYEGAPVPVVMLVASAPKVAAFGMAMRLLPEALPGLFLDWQSLMIPMAMLSVMLGNVVALAQTHIRRMLAYSTIAHVGYIWLGLLSGLPVGYAAAMFYVISYAALTVAVFAVLMLLSQGGRTFEQLDDFKGLASHQPWAAAMMSFLILSLAGIPPSVGFVAKYQVVLALVDAELLPLAVLAMLLAVVGLYYYLRIIRLMYFEKAQQCFEIEVKAPYAVVLGTHGFMLVLLGLLPGTLIGLCRFLFVS